MPNNMRADAVHALRSMTVQRTAFRAAVLCLIVLTAGSLAPAIAGAQATYNINLTITSAEPTGNPSQTDSVVGTITTDGTIGVLQKANILGWTLNLIDGLNSANNVTLTPANSTIVGDVGNGLSASASGLSFNFSDTNAWFGIQGNLHGAYSGWSYLCLSASTGDCLAGITISPQYVYDDGATETGAAAPVGNQPLGGGGSPPPNTTFSGSVLFGLNNDATTGVPPCISGDPVNCATGNLVEARTDFLVRGRGRALSLVRTFNGLDAASASAPNALGYGWTHSYAESLSIDGSGNVTVHRGDGSTVPFTKSGGLFTAPGFVIASLIQNGNGTYTFTLPNQRADVFDSTGRLMAETDRNGYQTLLTYGTSGQLIAVTDPAGRSLKFRYQADGLLASVSDPIGRTVNYAYDSHQNLVSVTDAAGNTTSYGYDGSHRLTRVTTPNGGVASNTYDGSNRVVSQTDPAGRTTTFAYGNATTTITDGNGHAQTQTYTNNRLTALTRGVGSTGAATWTFAYDASGNRISGTDPNGHTWRATYDSHGNQLKYIDALGRTTAATYDAQNNVLTRTDALGVTTSYTYDGNGNLVTKSRPLAGSARTSTFTLKYGDVSHPGDVTTVVDPLGAAWLRAYDGAGNLIRLVNPDNDIWAGTYNGVGWLTSTISPRGNAGNQPANFTKNFSYSPLGELLQSTDALGHVTQFTYDADRNLVSETDADGHVTHFAYDADDELVKTTRNDGSVLTTNFDSAGLMVGQTDGLGRKTLYAYDALNRLVTVTDPLGRSTRYGYDGAGNRISVLDPNSQLTTLSYDAANQLTGISYSDGTTAPVSFTYDQDGQRASMKDATGTSVYQFDSLHRLANSTDGAGNHVGYAYDLRGSLIGITYPSGKTVTRTYDPAGRLTAVSDWLGHTSTIQYDPDGNVVGTNYGNGVKAAFGFDDADRLTAIDYGFLRFGYARDDLGLITGVESGGRAEQRRYTYSSINELIDSGAAKFNYDPADNLTQLDRELFSYDDANELTQEARGSSLSLTYDARGNRLSGSDRLQYRYDQANRLAAIGSDVHFSYNGDGLRMTKTVGNFSRAFVWDQSGGLPQLLTDGTLQFIYGPRNLPLEQIDAVGRVSWFHQDQLGSTRALTDEHARVIDRYSFSAYGLRRGEDRWDAGRGAVTPLLFAGQYTDEESGLQYLRARYYDPRTGQFLTRDPRFSATRSPYLYASGDPVNRVDPTGADADSAGDTMVAIAYPTGGGGLSTASDVGVGGDSGAGIGAAAGLLGGDSGGGSCSIDASNYDEVAGIADSIKGFFTKTQPNIDAASLAITVTDTQGTDPALQKLSSELNALKNSTLDPSSYEFRSKLYEIYNNNKGAYNQIQPALSNPQLINGIVVH